jgi:hypothetical protein
LIDEAGTTSQQYLCIPVSRYPDEVEAPVRLLLRARAPGQLCAVFAAISAFLEPSATNRILVGKLLMFGLPPRSTFYLRA